MPRSYSASQRMHLWTDALAESVCSRVYLTNHLSPSRRALTILPQPFLPQNGTQIDGKFNVKLVNYQLGRFSNALGLGREDPVCECVPPLGSATIPTQAFFRNFSSTLLCRVSFARSIDCCTTDRTRNEEVTDDVFAFRSIRGKTN